MVSVAGRMEGWTLSFEDFFTREYPAIYRAAYLGTGSHEAAKDVTQEAFARAYSRWRRLEHRDWVGGWVMTTALNLCKKHHREANRSAGSTIKEQVTTHPTWDRDLDLAAALRRLPIRQRTAIVLSYLGDLPLHQIAHLMHVSEGTVKAHLAQARKTLRRSMGETDE